MLESRTSFQIAKKDLKNFFYKFILLACVVSILVEIRVAIMELSLEQHIGLVVEYSGALGIILFSGIFLEENNPALRELINSKNVDLQGIYFVRYILSFVALMLILFAWGLVYATKSSLKYVLLYFVNAFSDSFLFGNLTFVLYILKNNAIITYMVSFFLFLLYVENLNIPPTYVIVKNCIFILCGILLTCFSFLGVKYKQKV